MGALIVLQMMLEFLTLFLALMSGEHEVELAVGPRVATVEIVLDNERRQILEGRPWRLKIDLGESLRPHLLEAIAHDAEGRELERIIQAINLPRAPAEARIVLVHDGDGRPVAVRVVWEAITDVEPSSVSVRCDESALEAENGLFPLPDLDMNAPHVLSAELHFPGRFLASAHATLGGVFGSEISTDLSAVLIEPPMGRPPTTADVRIYDRAQDQALKVVAFEQPSKRIFVVTDPAAFRHLERIARMLDGRGLRGFTSNPLYSGERARPEDDLVMLVHPRPELHPVRGQATKIFPFVGPLTLATHSLPWVVSHARLESMARAPKQLADAVAAAGVAAAGSATPRAVVLITSQHGEDDSQYAPREVLGYLGLLGVPLHVWAVDGDRCAWPNAISVSSPKKMRAAAESLLFALDRQWIAWVEGCHYPHELSSSVSSDRTRSVSSQ